MHPFTYVRAENISAAARLLTSQSDAKLLAGGMSLLPTMKLRLASPALLVDLAPIRELGEIKRNGRSLCLGSMARHHAVASSALVSAVIPALSSLASGIGDVQVRRRGSIGGSVANSDPAADYPAAVLGLGASIQTNRRTIPADEFFIGLFETALATDEIITAIEFPIPEAAAYVKFANDASRFAIVGVFVARFRDEVRVAVTGAASHVFRVSSYETLLRHDFLAERLEGAEVSAKDLLSDLHGTAEYRANLINVLARRGVRQCCETAA